MPDEEEPPDPEAKGQGGWNPADRLRAEMRRIERLLDPGLGLLEQAGERYVLPAWQRVTEGEPRWPVSLAVVVAIALQLVLPERVAFRPRWLLPALQALMLIGIIAANPKRIDRESMRLRTATIGLIGVSSLANAWSAGRLVLHLVNGTLHQNPAHLLITGAAIWITNVIVFALWYWECDRGGPAGRVQADRYPDFLFAQMQSPEVAAPDWEPGFADYLYLSFTNASAFSPTDVLPLSRWAKMTMMLQAGVSLSTVALVVARAVNVLK
ncbi:MAG: hypothetical protein ACXVQY_12105 [Actinomycetota bacterium]